VVNGQAIALITLEELTLAGLSAVDEVQSFELADPVNAGSLLFWHGDGMLHDDPGEQGTPIGMTIRDLDAGSVVRHFRDGFIPLEAEIPDDDAERLRRQG
jgi:hypothetical protein